jgi:hypothetical protein
MMGFGWLLIVVRASSAGDLWNIAKYMLNFKLALK